MPKRATGAVYCLIAVLLYCARLLMATIFASRVSNTSESFALHLESEGGTPLALSLAALMVGPVYIGYAEWEDYSGRPLRR